MGLKIGAIAANCGVSMEKKSDNHVHGQFVGTRKFEGFKSSRVSGPRVLIHVRVSRYSARVVKCVVK
jgi:hypothetical protein